MSTLSCGLSNFLPLCTLLIQYLALAIHGEVMPEAIKGFMHLLQHIYFYGSAGKIEEDVANCKLGLFGYSHRCRGVTAGASLVCIT